MATIPREVIDKNMEEAQLLVTMMVEKRISKADFTALREILHKHHEFSYDHYRFVSTLKGE